MVYELGTDGKELQWLSELLNDLENRPTLILVDIWFCRK